MKTKDEEKEQKGIFENASKVMRLLKTVSCALFLFFLPAMMRAQEGREIIIHADPRIEELISKQAAADEEKGTMPGYRIQLISSNNRKDVLDIKLDCHEKFPSLATYLIYQKPYFKLRAGDYLTRLDSYRTLVEIRKIYLDAFIVRDEVEVAVLK